MKKWVSIGSAALLMFAFGACGDLDDLTDLDVINDNNPDRERALSEAGDIESLVSSGFFLWYDGELGSGSPPSPLATAGEETSVSWGNHGAQQLGTEPRVQWPNSASWRYRALNERPWYRHYEALSSIYDGFKAIEAQPELCDEIDCDRAHAFGRLVQGLSHAYLGVMFDSAFIYDETIDLETDALELKPYPNVVAAAEGYLNDAVSESSGAAWALPSAWIRGNGWDAAYMARFASSMKARLLYQFARTPGEMTTEIWNKIIAAVDAGIQSGGPGVSGAIYERDGVFLEGDVQGDWWGGLIYYATQTAGASWHRADYKAIGYYDQSTGYTDWLAASLNDRDDFVLNTIDERVHAPGDGQGDGIDFVFKGASPFPASRGTYFYSMYMNANYEEYSNGDQGDPIPIMLYVTQQLIKAEALAQTGNLAAAKAIVDVTRVGRGNLPPASATDLNQLLGEIYYDHIIENMVVASGGAYFPRRHFQALSPTGPNHHWGLVEGTPLHFPIPGKELEILQKLNYSYGGVGFEGGTLTAAAASGVGTGTTVPARAIYAFNGLETTADKLDYIYRDRDDRPSAAVMNLVRH